MKLLVAPVITGAGIDGLEIQYLLIFGNHSQGAAE